MAATWSLSPDLRTFLKGTFQEHRPNGLGTDVFPSILWSLGGELHKSEAEIEKIAPHYSLGWIKRSDIGRFIAIDDQNFGVVAFRPKSEDVSAPLKVVDFVNGKIEAR